MPGKNQKVVTIPLDLWVRVKEEYESRPDYWADRDVKSTTALLNHYIKTGVGEDVSATKRREEFEALREELQTIKDLVKLKLAEEDEMGSGTGDI